MSGGRQRLVEINYPLIPKTRQLERAHPVSNTIDEAIAPFTSSLTLAEPMPQGVEGEVLVESSPTSFRASSIRHVTPQALSLAVPGQEPGPHPLAVAAKGRFSSFFTDKPIPPPPGLDVDDPANPDDPTEKILDGSPTRMVVVGSADFVANNVPFVLNAVDWLAEDVALMDIRGRVADRDLLEPPERPGLWKAGIVGAPVGVLLLVGLGVALASRRRR